MADLFVAGRSSLIGLHRILRDADGGRVTELARLAAGRAVRSAEIVPFPTTKVAAVRRPIMAAEVCAFPVRSKAQAPLLTSAAQAAGR